MHPSSSTGQPTAATKRTPLAGGAPVAGDVDSASSPTGASPAQPATAAPSSVSRAAWLAWGIAAAGYLLAIFHRMALGVAALDAEDRLAVGAGSIAALSVVGLTAYLSMQVPAGLISDRIGPRRGLAIGLAIIAGGEALFAFSTAMPLSLVGRALVGAGDAFIFLNVLRIAAHWFPRERFASMTAATATLGAVGQVVGTVPLNASLGGLGWSATFAGSAVLTLVIAAVLLVFLRERPAGQLAPARHDHDPILVSLRRSWARPTTRDGFWVHLTAMAPFVVVTGLWGAPILVDAQGLTRGQASAVLLVAVVVSGITALLIGAAARRDPSSRHALTMRVSLASIAGLAVLTFTPAAVIPGVVSLLCISLIASGMGAGMLGFDLARRPDDHRDGASTSALVNLGGFSAAIVGMALVGAARTILGADTGFVLLPTLLIATFGAWRLSQRPGWQRRTRGLSQLGVERAAR